MSHRDKALLCVIGVIAVIAGAFFLVVKPKQAEIKNLDSQVSQAQSRVNAATALIQQEQAARAQLGSNVGGVLAAGKAVPTTVAMPALLRQLQDAGDSHGVTMSALTTNSTPTGGASGSTNASTSTPGVTSQQLSLTFDGGFLDLQRFLARLQSFVDVSRQRVTATGRLLSLDKVTLATGKESAGLTATVAATIYTLDPSALNGPATGTATTPSASGAPAPAGASTPTPTATAGAPR